MKTKEYTALAPGDIENKYYCPGIGIVLSADVGTVDTGNREELAKVNGSQADGGATPGADAAPTPDGGADAAPEGGADAAPEGGG